MRNEKKLEILNAFTFLLKFITASLLVIKIHISLKSTNSFFFHKCLKKIEDT